MARRGRGTGRGSRGVRRAGLLQDCRVPALQHRRGRRPRSSSSALPTTSPSTATEDARSSPTPTSSQYEVVIFLSTTGDVLTPTSRRRSSATSRPAAATPASTRPPTPSTTGPGTATWSAPTSTTTRPAPRTRPSRSRTRRTRPPRACRSAGSVRRVVQLPHSQPSPPGTSARPGLAGRDDLHPGHRRDGRRAPDRLVPGLRRRPRLVHRHGSHRGELRRAALPRAHPRRHPDRCRCGRRGLRRP